MTPDVTPFDDAARQVVELANRLADENPDMDVWDPMCDDCAPVSTAELRKGELMKSVQLSAEESDYFHSPTDSNAAWA